ncbi:uncharacterized protein MELLADRAFT_61738 [Melampsora larici-populina 98AG31]|uniref:DUF6589 domain-containing protein n=1 Tax=Melampsora larici-populina (strain 98AG31 / pathotype 3-4-7) TaxID=747676 RepID=F4RFY4_MELLP|nr:uncharacterized protein MELLADRAFT_61738 [Melampsora larici-populina 98AG31]EGG08451.1 hypothetical protein MELLADRAFT_61738 [Melampsora larici-populina 98AG31]
MTISSNPVSPPGSQEIPVTVQNAILICKYMTKLGVTPKQFMVTFLSSTQEELAVRRRLSKIGKGGRETRSIFKNLGRLTTASHQGRDEWDKLILDEVACCWASAIVNQQEITRGAFPMGAFVSSNAITPNFFTESAEKYQNDQVRSGMKFLHTLIYRKTAHAMKKKEVFPYEDVPLSPEAQMQDGEARVEGALDDDTVLSMENLVHIKATPASQAEHKLSKELGLPAFLESMAAAQRKPVKVSTFCPGAPEMKHWRLVLKAQVAKALIEYIDNIPGQPKNVQLPSLSITPPAIDPIEMHKPNLHFLRMMDAPDSSAEGVSRVIDKVLGQIGLDSETYANKLLVAGGDVGSNQLVESLRVKRFPPIDSVEGYEWVLSVFGGAHTSWNFTKALWIHHWGNPSKGTDTGVWRSAFALGLEYKKPAGSQDFNTIMRSCQIVHKANLIFIIASVIAFLFERP